MAEALNATFFAFGKREKGGVLLRSGIAYAVGLLLLVVAFVAVAWAVMGQDLVSFSQQMADMGTKGGAAAGSLPANFGRVFLLVPIGLVGTLLLFVLLAAFESACLRWMIRGERSGPLGLCFGADMWRVYGTYWAWFLYFFCTYILFLLVLFLSVFAGGAVGGNGNSMAAAAVVLAVCLIWILGWIYVAVRLGPAAATSIGAGHFAPLKAWSVSRGRFWALFGSDLLLALLFLIATLIVAAICMGPFFAAVFSHVDWTAARGDPTAFSRSYQQANIQAMRDLFASPLMLALYFGGQIAIRILGIVFYVLFYGVNARAVQAALEEGKIEHAPAS